MPVRAGEISCRLLGCAVDAFDPDGAPVPARRDRRAGPSTAPMPSMPVGFWGDDDGSRYRAAYFEDYPGVWRHGDWITFTDDGASIITGRSDATLNRGGVRLGTSDFYTVVEALARGGRQPGRAPRGPRGRGPRRAAAVREPGRRARPSTTTCAAPIGAALRHELSPRHVPDRVEAVPVVPRTLSGKKLEVPVKRILTGTPAEQAASRDSLADPSSLAPFEAIAAARARRLSDSSRRPARRRSGLSRRPTHGLVHRLRELSGRRARRPWPGSGVPG